jgi:ATP-dependent 26S proteasome regulatory subunit
MLTIRSPLERAATKTSIASSRSADGVGRAQGRKIIFTTNLRNVHDIDSALLRPGRCFAVSTIKSRLRRF